MTIKKQKTLFSISYFIFYFATALQYCLLISYLTKIGYTSSQRGIMLACGSLCSFVLQFIFSYLADKHHTIRRYAQIINVMIIISSLLLYSYQQFNYPIHLFLSVLAFSTFRVATGMQDSWILESGEELKTSFGFMRGFGSIGWAVGSYLISFICDNYGYFYVGIATAVAVAGMMLFNQFVLPDAQKKAEGKVNGREIQKLFSNKLYILIIAALFFIFMMQAALDMTIVDKISVFNGSNEQVSMYWAVTAICEVPLFFIGTSLSKRFKALPMLLTGTVIYTLRFVLYGMSVNVDQIIWISVLQMFSFPIIQMASKTLVDEQIPDNLKSSGQQMALAIYSTVSSLVSPLIAGEIETAFNIDFALYIFALMGIISIVIIGFYMKPCRKPRSL